MGQRTTVNFPNDLHSKILHITVDRKISMGEYVVEACQEKLEREENQPPCLTEHPVFTSLKQAILKDPEPKATLTDPATIKIEDMLPCLFCGRTGCPGKCRK